MSLIDEINELRKELDIKERAYLNETIPCETKSCGFYRPNALGHCSWSALLEECKDYTDSIEKNIKECESCGNEFEKSELNEYCLCPDCERALQLEKKAISDTEDSLNISMR